MTELETLLRKQWTKRDGSPDESMVKYCLTSANYIDVFYNYNMQGKRFDLDELIKERNGGNVWVYTNYTRDNTGGKLKGWTVTRYGEVPTHLGDYHRATDDDIMAIKQGLATMKAAYEKRLQTYWKRYSNKVSARGYWANR